MMNLRRLKPWGGESVLAELLLSLSSLSIRAVGESFISNPSLESGIICFEKPLSKILGAKHFKRLAVTSGLQYLSSIRVARISEMYCY